MGLADGLVVELHCFSQLCRWSIILLVQNPHGMPEMICLAPRTPEHHASRFSVRVSCVSLPCAWYPVSLPSLFVLFLPKSTKSRFHAPLSAQ